ncbi:MAG TPA: penicillin-insensitive murein endopeptidase, partial [Pyrinomonadaceae bacterium]
ELYLMTGNDREGHENRAWVFYNLGDLNRRLQRHEQAAAFFESALQTEVMIHGGVGLNSVGTLDSLAHTFEARKDYPAAIAHYEQLLSLLDGAVNEKGRYFKLNVANVHGDLADLYIAQAYASGPGIDDKTRRKVWQETMKAIHIWEDVLKSDPEALDQKYQETVDKLQRRVMPGTPMSEYNTSYLPKLEEIRVRQQTLLNDAMSPPERLPIGPPNPGNDPAITAQLAAEGPGYVLFDRRTERAYGRRELVNLIRAVAAEWNKRHPDLKLVVADLSLRGGGPFARHGSDHQDGREVDIWPVTNNGQPEPTNTYAPNYSRELTTELVNLIRQTNPAAVVYLDDPPLVDAGLVHATHDHNNYMHVLLP